ncbi:MAG: phosphatase PAP2 family protein [Hymenobacter sp.]|nr:MAG: phosphatase PAP2 family protein [Hymenobacter sp.]
MFRMMHYWTLLKRYAARPRQSTCLLALGLWLGLAPAAYAQVPLNPAAPAADTTHKYENPSGTPTAAKKPFFKSKVFRAAIVPAVLIGYGAYTFNGGGFYTNDDARRDIHRLFPTSHSRVADYLIFAPYLELGAVTLAGVESHNDRLNLLLIIAKSEAIMLSSTFIVKALSHEERPDGSDNLSFPSGHTAQAFLAASIVHTELRDKSPWYGIGAYAIATSVAGLRMVNDKHWQSDVVAGAGFGILSAHLAYLTHRNRWGRKSIGRDVGVMPTFFGSTPGLTLTWRAH